MSGFDPVNKPEHYNSHPSGVECVEITEHMTCMIGCAIKYLWRHGLKAGADADQDLQKAIWCIERERARLKKAAERPSLKAMEEMAEQVFVMKDSHAQ